MTCKMPKSWTFWYYKRIFWVKQCRWLWVIKYMWTCWKFTGLSWHEAASCFWLSRSEFHKLLQLQEIQTEDDSAHWSELAVCVCWWVTISGYEISGWRVVVIFTLFTHIPSSSWGISLWMTSPLLLLLPLIQLHFLTWLQIWIDSFS